ncbi:MAG: ABC transporter permease [Anaerolineae bacterium]|jgi:ABC-type lipoprotein release transport system permease subunit|nr:MAG: ABC transporter permease [Anaerolineae bacterium]
MIAFLKLALRNLGRNRRRSFFSALALALGFALLLIMASFLRGEMESALQTSIRLQSGHLQVRSSSYDEDKNSLKWEDLVNDPLALCAQIKALPGVKDATPRLIASGILVARDQSAGVRVLGLEPEAPASEPYRLGLLQGDFLAANDREGLLIGKPLADKLHLSVGDRVSLSVNTSNGDVDEQRFIVRGIYSTQTYAFDSSTLLLPLAKAQAMTRTENYASLIFILLNKMADSEAVRSRLTSLPYSVLDWKEMNEIIVQFEDMANSYMSIFYLIVLAITASVITNTLIMAVFERTREIGILSAIGWRSKEIVGLFLYETALLTVGGILIGLILGLAAVGYLATHGFYIGGMGMSGFLIGDTIYAQLTLKDTVQLMIVTIVITMLAGLYPAILAARLEPVDALRGGKHA